MRPTLSALLLTLILPALAGAEEVELGWRFPAGNARSYDITQRVSYESSDGSHGLSLEVRTELGLQELIGEDRLERRANRLHVEVDHGGTTRTFDSETGVGAETIWLSAQCRRLLDTPESCPVPRAGNPTESGWQRLYPRLPDGPVAVGASWEARTEVLLSDVLGPLWPADAETPAAPLLVLVFRYRLERVETPTEGATETIAVVRIDARVESAPAGWEVELSCDPDSLLTVSASLGRLQASTLKLSLEARQLATGRRCRLELERRVRYTRPG